MGGIVLVGCGKMGAALLSGWIGRGIGAPYRIVEPNRDAAAAFAARADVTWAADAAGLPPDCDPDAVVIAVKPQLTEAALPPYARFARALYLSIAAGRKLDHFAGLFGAGAAIVRAMPNTPAQHGRGIAVLCANRAATPAQRALAERLMAAVGEVAWGDEGMMDAVTAVSGSGPAYAFLLVECMAAAGEAQGLPPDLAMRLARATVAGAGELLHRSSESAAALRQAVTSPRGTTQAALDVLMAPDGLAPLMARAVAAAARRGRELAAG